MSRSALTIGVALAQARARIDAIDALYLLCFAIGQGRAFISAHPEQPLTQRETLLYETVVASRAMGVPVAYLTQAREFYGYPFFVDARVLIPRPETELLVDTVKAQLAATHDPTILDIGTGSGVIGITLALEVPKASVVATDVSKEALDVAIRNATALGLATSVPRRWEARLGALYAPVLGQRFAVIVSNPPYIAGNDPHLELGDLRFEPALALTDGSVDGAQTLRALVAQAPLHLLPGGWIWLEHGYDQADRVRACLTERGFTAVATRCDLAGLERVTGGQWGVQEK
jgi:release factor glutamine methyltransferase